MKVHGNLDLLNNLLLNPVLDQQENFPVEPKVGQFIFKGQRVMICIELDAGLPIWVPLTPPMNTFVHDQATGSTMWEIDHNLNTSHLIAQVIGNDGKHIIPDEVQCDFNKTTIYFSKAQSGRAVLMIGNTDGVPRANYTYEETFESPSAIWEVNHLLGQEPLIRVFVGNQEVQPLSIHHQDQNTAIVTFSSPRTGFVRCL